MKKALILVAVVILLGLGYMMFPKDAGKDTTPEQNDAMQQDNAMIDDSMEEKTDDAMMQEDGAYMVQSESSVSYVVQKEWFGKPAETVVGTSNEVRGNVMYDAETDVLESINIMLSTESLGSGSDGRDKEVVEMLGENISISTASPISGVATGEVSLTIPLDVTINGQTNTVDFDVTGTVNDTMVDVKGTATANVSDFGVEAPSLLGVYTVAEEMNLNFDLKASK